MRIAIPNKGRLHEPTMDLLWLAGLHVEAGPERKLYAGTVDPDVTVLFVRAGDIPEYVADGAADLGITGYDQVREADVDLVDRLDLGYGRCRIVLAAPDGGPIEAVDDLDGKAVATEFPRVPRAFFDERGVDPEIVEVTGATELTGPGEKGEEVVAALSSVVAAEDRRYLMCNVPEDRLTEVRDVLPGMGGPTVTEIAGEDAVAVHAVVDERAVFETITELRAVGAHDVLVTEIERLME
ncbi:ATP phosphoribosyltransferase [Halobacteriales archaeon SW_7_68_16]|nr:MAG: ATP phosphoribosyltransferase [Halobacteriales archaeon SW_7_68_16]